MKKFSKWLLGNMISKYSVAKIDSFWSQYIVIILKQLNSTLMKIQVPEFQKKMEFQK